MQHPWLPQQMSNSIPAAACTHTQNKLVNYSWDDESLSAARRTEWSTTQGRVETSPYGGHALVG